MEATFVVVGGGIAGVSCAETLAYLKPDEPVVLVSESPVVKAVVNLRMVTKTISTFDVVERDLSALHDSHAIIRVLHDKLVAIRSGDHIIRTANNGDISYRYLCVCTGARPKLIPQAQHSPLVVGVRDTDSVDTLIRRVGAARRVALVGNGGIATELVHKMQNVHIDWIIKDAHTTATFLDPGSAEFFRASVEASGEEPPQTYRTQMRFRQEGQSGTGAALGPDWYTKLDIRGASGAPKSLTVHQECEVVSVREPAAPSDHQLLVELTGGVTLACDVLVSATGVVPCTDFAVAAPLTLSPDGGILVDERMCSSVPDVFAAGDVCTPGWPLARHWFPMKLWSQARQMGCYAAKCMTAALDGQPIMQDFCFELFAHSTTLFGHKVVLLGLYNGQKLATDYECLIRMTPGTEFIKFVMQDHRLQGAILIGNTDLAETCENLILNQLDLSPYGDDILNPDIDIEDYFD